MATLVLGPLTAQAFSPLAIAPPEFAVLVLSLGVTAREPDILKASFRMLNFGFILALRIKDEA